MSRSANVEPTNRRRQSFLVTSQSWLIVSLMSVLGSCAGVSVCATGFEEVDGLCLPTCEQECGEHERCVVGDASAECACAPGYDGDPCEWSGVIVDPDLSDGDEAWATTKGAALTPGGAGLAVFSSAATCNAGAISQTVEMPTYEEAEPLMARIVYRKNQVGDVDLAYGGVARAIPVEDRFSNDVSVCLGEAAYGGSVEFRIAAAMPEPSCFIDPVGTFELDLFDIVVAPEGRCPAPGEVLNGDAEGEGGWTFEREPFVNIDSEADFFPESGESGSTAVGIRKPAGGERMASMRTQVSIPLASTLQSPALRFWWRGDPSWTYLASLGNYTNLFSIGDTLDSLYADGEAQTSTYCVPPRLHGAVADLSFQLLEGSFSTEAELFVDQVELVSDSRCGNSTEILDPSFDSAPLKRPGIFVQRRESDSGTVGVIDDSERARSSGTGMLEMRYARNDAWLNFRTWVRVPEPEGTKGPLLVFYSNAPEVPGVSVFWNFGDAVTPNLDCSEEFCAGTRPTQRLPLGLGWRRNDELCLPPEWAGRWFLVRFAIRPDVPRPPLEIFDPPRALLLDDFELTTDERCRAE